MNLRQQGRIVHGTFENFITFYKNVWRWKPSSEVKFDCITIHNTVHGFGRNDRNILVDLLSTVRKLAKYIVISEPNWNSWNEEEQLEIKEKINWDKHYKKIHTFPKTYGLAELDHHIYEVI